VVVNNISIASMATIACVGYAAKIHHRDTEDTEKISTLRKNLRIHLDILPMIAIKSGITRHLCVLCVSVVNLFFLTESYRQRRRKRVNIMATTMDSSEVATMTWAM
jgi:hypothetical protein